LQDLGAANRSGVDESLRVFDVDFREVFGKLIENVDDVRRDDVSSERNYDASADLCVSDLVGS
jgi:hypothetical protein